LSSEVERGYSTIDPFMLLWMDDCSGGDFGTLLVNSTSIVEHTISNMIPGTSCRYRMNTLNIIGYSLTYSPILSVPYSVIPESPAAPEYVTRHGGQASAEFNPYITIKWKNPVDNGGSPILGFKIEASFNSNPVYALLYDGSANSSTKEFKFRDLTAGATYSFRVYARNEIGWCALPSASILIYAATYPHKMDPPTMVLVVPNTGSGKASIKVKWTSLPSGQDGASPVLGYYL